MINKQPNGQHTQRYRYRATASVSRPVTRRNQPGKQLDEGQRTRREVLAEVGSTGRTVTMPRQAVQPVSWAERKARFHDTHGQPALRGRLVQRTFEQTGHRAPVGQLRASRSLPRQQVRITVPTRRSQQRRGSFWRKLFGFLAVIIVLSGGLIFAFRSSIFHVQQVIISGTQNSGLVHSIQHMGIQGQNIFLLNTADLIGRLDASPLVASASLSTQLPGSVMIHIQEREPALLWQTGQNTFGIAQDGVVIAPLSELSGTRGLATVIDIRQEKGASQVHPGTHFDNVNIRFAQQVWQLLPAVPGMSTFRLQYTDELIIEGRAVPANQVGNASYIIVSTEGWQAYLGDGQNSNSLANRLLELQQILTIAQVKHLHLSTIDLRFGLRPTYTVKA